MPDTMSANLRKPPTKKTMTINPKRMSTRNVVFANDRMSPEPLFREDCVCPSDESWLASPVCMILFLVGECGKEQGKILFFGLSDFKNDEI